MFSGLTWLSGGGLPQPLPTPLAPAINNQAMEERCRAHTGDEADVASA
jgi:hypothetical protein